MNIAVTQFLLLLLRFRTRYDDKPGSKRAQFCWEGNQMYPQLDRELHFGFQKNGSLVVARCKEDEVILQELMERGAINGVKNLRLLGQKELREMEPSITDDAISALYSPDAGTVTPYEFTIAVAENAADNGIEFRLSREVTDIFKEEDGSFVVKATHHPTLVAGNSTLAAACAGLLLVSCLAWLFVSIGQDIPQTLEDIEGLAAQLLSTVAALAFAVYVGFIQKQTVTRKEKIKTKHIVNAAGCFSDKIANMVGPCDFEMKPRMGEYLLLHKDQGKFCRHIIFPAPGVLGKGVVTQPTLWGNLLLGPTARDCHNPDQMKRSVDDICQELLSKTREMIQGFDPTKVIHSFAGARAKSSRGDWVIEEHPDVPRFIQAAAIDSPGLAGSPAIALEVVRLLKTSGLSLPKYEGFNPFRKPIITPKVGHCCCIRDCTSPFLPRALFL